VLGDGANRGEARDLLADLVELLSRDASQSLHLAEGVNDAVNRLLSDTERGGQVADGAEGGQQLVDREPDAEKPLRRLRQTGELEGRPSGEVPQLAEDPLRLHGVTDDALEGDRRLLEVPGDGERLADGATDAETAEDGSKPPGAAGEPGQEPGPSAVPAVVADRVEVTADLTVQRSPETPRRGDDADVSGA
jgi:hypothetical protein